MQAERLEGQNAIARHGPDGVIVNGTEYRHPVIVPWHGTVVRWQVSSFEALQASDFEPVLAMRPQVLIFGSGPQLRFAHPRLLASLMAAGIGVETMDNAAACRTYNVLLAEGRDVAAALLFADSSATSG